MMKNRLHAKLGSTARIDSYATKSKLVMKLLLAILALFFLNIQVGFGQSYTTTAVTTAWNASRWNNSADGPTYTTTYTANNNVNFTTGTYNFAGMGAVIFVGNVTVASGVTVNFTSTGSTFSTNGNVRTFEIGIGGLFDFNAQTISSGATTGIIKSGPGVFATGAGNFTGGFTLNVGTVIARGTTGFGSGSGNILTLNGGTIASNGTKDFANTRFPGGIVIGGNIQFGEIASNVALADPAANLSFANNISLGSSLRTLTLGNGGTQTFSGVITGTGGLIFAANANGTGSFVLTGVNTYTGNTTISSGTLALTAGCSIAASPIITVGSAGSFNVSGLTTALALASTQTLKSSATGRNTSGTITVASGKGLTLGSTGGLEFTAYDGGATAPLTISGASAGALALNSAPITVTTTTALAAGTYTLIAKAGSATGVTGTIGTLTVAGSGLAASTTGALSIVSGELILTVTASGPTITIANLTTGIAASPLLAGTTNQAIFGFSATSASGTPAMTQIKVSTSTTSVSKFTNIKIFSSTDSSYATAGDNVELTSGVTITQNAGNITIDLTSQSLSTSAQNYFLVVNVAGTVTSATTAVQPSLTNANLTVTGGTITGGTLTGTNYSFVAPEINVQGNSISITDGDITPATADHTDLGSGSSLTKTFTIQNIGSSALSVGTITISGTNAADFSVTTAPNSSVAAAGSTTFVVTFTAGAAGTRSAEIAIVNDDNDENPYNFSIQALGVLAGTPSIVPTGTLVAVNTTYGSASASPTSFNFTGSDLTADVVVTPPTGFEVAVGTGAYANTQTVSFGSGTIASTTINVRLKASTNAGTYSGNITFVSADNSTAIVATASSTVFKKALTVGTPSIASKVYDATSTSGTVTLGTLSGFVGTETVTATAVSAFADRNVNAAKTATIVYTLVDGANGGLSSNYSLADGSVTGAITAKPITLNGLSVPASKVYDGSTIAVVTGSPGSLQSSSAPGAGTTEDGKPYSGDTISLTGTATGTYNDANVANASTVSFGGLSLTGAQSSNYSLTIQSNQAATITKANQTITFGALANQTTATIVDYTPGATSASSGTNAITYISSNLAVATIVNGLIHIVGVGTTNITATQVATTNYNAAADVSQSLTVTLVPVSIAIQDFETSPATPTWTYSATGGVTNSTTNKFNGAISYRLGNSEILTMDNVDISNYTSVSLSVTFAADGPDSGEDLFMDISYDNGSTWIGSGSVKLVDGFSGTQININNTNVLDPTTVATNPWPTSIAGSETQIRVRFRVVALDASEYYWIDDVKVTGILNTSPIIIRTPASLSGFSQNSVTPSAEQTYTVSGNNLTASVSITPPTGFEISTTSGGSFSATNPIILTQSGGDLVGEPVTIYVRQNLGVLGAVSGNITNASTGASDINTALSGTRTGTYYYSGSGNLDVLTNWGLNTDGTGSNPSNFTSDGVIYEIRNAATATIGANWTVSGAASKVVVGDGTNATDFIIPSGFSLIGTIDVNNTAELTIENTTSPTFGILAANSTLEYNNVAATLSLSSVLTYGNLKLSGTGTKTFPGHSTNTTKITGNLTLNNTTIDGVGSSPFSTILLAGNLTYVGTVTPPADANSITLSTNGTAAGSQTFMGAGNTLRWFRITTTTANTIVLSTSGGSSNVLLGNATSGGLTLLDGSILNMNGNDFQMFNGGASFILNTTGSISTTTSTDFNIERTITGILGTMRFTSGSNTIGNLTLNHVGATNTLTIGNALNVNGVITVTDGTLASGGNITLKSDATITSSVAAIGSGGTITGNVTVERYIPNKRAWRALTTPLKGSNASVFSQWQNNGAIVPNIGVEIWGPLGTGSTGNGLAVGPSNSMLQYVAGAWSPITDSKTTNLFTTNGNNAFMVFPTGGYGSNLILSAATPVPTTLKATGQLITGPVTFANLPSASHTLIGNPYASPIDIATMLGANTGFSGYVWVWDANLVGDYSVGAYNLFDRTVGTSGNYSNLTDNTGISGAQIQSGQAFFVKPTTNLSTFTIQEAHKGSAFSNAVFRNATSAEVLRVGLYKQTNNQWSGRDGAMAVFLSDAEANQADNKMANGSENVAFTKNGILFASEHHLPLVASDVLNVKVWNTTAGANYKLKINTEQFATTNLNATLEDVFTNSRTPIALDGTAVEYPFAVTTEAASTGNRFRIVFETNALGINNPKASGITILPNPITGDAFQVNLGTLGIGTYAYTISNALGQEVEKGSINNVTQNSSYTVKFKNSAAAGMYIMKVIGADNTVFTAKIIKQ